MEGNGKEVILLHAHSILIIEDDTSLAGLVASYLQQYGYTVVCVEDFRQVEQQFLALRPHLVLMDVTLPYQDGFHLTRQLRRHSAVPILFVSSRTGEMEQVFGMESGGDDYLLKPFKLEVMLAKVRALIRRAYGDYARVEPEALTVRMVGPLQLDLTSGEVRHGDRSQRLSGNEAKLLALLMRRPGETVRREECLEALWDDAAFVDDNTLTVNISRLRQRLADVGLPEAVETRRGEGYRLNLQHLEAER